MPVETVFQSLILLVINLHLSGFICPFLVVINIKMSSFKPKQ